MAGHKLIPMRNRAGEIVAEAIVDAEDFDSLTEHTWCWDGRYPRRNVDVDGRQYSVRMHRQVLGLERGDPLQGDHINGNRLDNRRANLRIVTHAEQMQNLAPQRNRRSSHRGVIWDGSRNRWQARVRSKFLGRFETEEEAALVAAAERERVMPKAVERDSHGVCI